MFISNANTLPTRTWAFPVSRSLLPRPRTPSTRACKPSTPTNFQRRKKYVGRGPEVGSRAPGRPVFCKECWTSVSTIGRRRKTVLEKIHATRSRQPSRLRGTGHSPHEPGQIRSRHPTPSRNPSNCNPPAGKPNGPLAKSLLSSATIRSGAEDIAASLGRVQRQSSRHRTPGRSVRSPRSANMTLQPVLCAIFLKNHADRPQAPNRPAAGSKAW